MKKATLLFAALILGLSAAVALWFDKQTHNKMIAADGARSSVAKPASAVSSVNENRSGDINHDYATADSARTESAQKNAVTLERHLLSSGRIDALRAKDVLVSDDFAKTLSRLASERSDAAKAAEDSALLQDALHASLEHAALESEAIQSSCSGSLCAATFDTVADADATSNWFDTFHSTAGGLARATFYDSVVLPNGRRQVRLLLSTSQSGYGGISIPTNGVPVTITGKAQEDRTAQSKP